MAIMAAEEEEEKTFSTPLNHQIYDDRPTEEKASARKNGTDTSGQKSPE